MSNNGYPICFFKIYYDIIAGSLSASVSYTWYNRHIWYNINLPFLSRQYLRCIWKACSSRVKTSLYLSLLAKVFWRLKPFHICCRSVRICLKWFPVCYLFNLHFLSRILTAVRPMARTKEFKYQTSPYFIRSRLFYNGELLI